jgi:hypothetical protein
MVRVRALSRNQRVRLPGFGYKAEEFYQCCAQSGAAEFSRPPAVWARHCVIGTLVVINGKHWDKHIKVGRVFDVAAGWVLRRLCDWLADWSLHFVGIGLRRCSVEVQVQQRLIDTVKILQVSEGN